MDCSSSVSEDALNNSSINQPTEFVIESGTAILTIGWAVSADQLGLLFTIEDGVKFTRLIPCDVVPKVDWEDVRWYLVGLAGSNCGNATLTSFYGTIGMSSGKAEAVINMYDAQRDKYYNFIKGVCEAAIDVKSDSSNIKKVTLACDPIDVRVPSVYKIIKKSQCRVRCYCKKLVPANEFIIGVCNHLRELFHEL